MKETLVENFLRISKIPRQSGFENKIADFFVEIAKENNLEFFRDENNNVLIKKRGNIDAEPIALQAHFDMVCVKREDINHNFDTDGIEVIFEGNKVIANKTSLGADQGVGLAMMLSIIEDKSLNHPDLEFIFTVEEETTFKGVTTFPYHKIISKQFINLDNSKDDVVFVGADGDICNQYLFKGNLIENNLPSYKIIIDNFPGGNSGENIDLSVNNAITTMANLLYNKDVYIKSINGGTMENDLATYCEVIINTNLDVYDIFRQYAPQIKKLNNNLCFSRNDTKKIINQILQLKCGFISLNISSANLGLISTIDNEIRIFYIMRSISEKELLKINDNTMKLGNNFAIIEMYRDSIWNVNNDSKLLKKYKELYFKMYSSYPREEICHGGCECSVIKNKIDSVDIISIGCIIQNYHTIYETTYIDSWIKIYNLLLNFIEIT